MKKLALICFIFIGATFISCEKEMEKVETIDGISQEVIQKIESLDLNTSDLVKRTLESPEGESMGEAYIVEGCIAMNDKDVATRTLAGGITSEQYRTYNLVSSPRTISVIGYTGGSNALTSKMKTALSWAIDNYNALNIGLTFTLTYGTSYSSKDIVVYKTTGSAGGVSGFPSGGKPYKYVQIFSGTDPYDTNVIEHVITHEIGHCIGMRHTDWNTRQSCGQSGESANPDGAVHIPGTPTGYDSNSLMLACFNSTEDGEFGYYDVVALEYLY